MKIKYSNYEKAKKEYKNVFKELSNAFEAYLSAMLIVNNNGFISGDIAQGWVDFISYVAKPREQIAEFSKSVNKCVDSFLLAFDKDQKYKGESILYDYSYPGLRDYSDKRFRELKQCAEKADYDSGLLNSIGNGLENAYYGFKNLFPWSKDDNSKTKKIKKTQEDILQWKDITKGILNNMQININQDDESYSKKIYKIDALQEKLYDYFEKLADIMVYADPYTFSMDQYVGDLDKAYNDIMVAYNNILVEDKITDEDVRNFIDGNNEEILDKQLKDIKKFLADLSSIEIGNADFWKMLIFQMFDITEGQVISRGDYDGYLRKAEIIELLEEIESTSSYEDSAVNEAIGEMESIISAAKEKGQSLYDYLNTHRDADGKLILDGRTKGARKFRKFLGKFGNILDILGTVDDGASVVYKLFVDYSKNEALLDSFEGNAQNLSAEMKSTFASIREMYENELISEVDDAISLVLSKGVDALYTISVGKIIGGVKASIGFVGSATGESACNAAKLQLLTFAYDEIDAAESAFKKSCEVLRTCDPKANNYKDCVNNFKNCFAIYTTTIKRLFEKMALASTGKMRDYYYYCSSQVSRMSIKNYNNMKIMTYEEYKKSF